MNVLSVHNFYQRPGGEDYCYRTQAALLESHGHRVTRYEDHNSRITSGLATAVSSIWNHRSYTRLRALADSCRPAVAHFYNTFPLISPSAYYAVRSRGAAVVHELGNYRLMCPGSLLMRDGVVCEECIEQHSFAPAVKHRCYRNSRMATASVAGLLSVHQIMETWREAVDAYIASSEFARRKFIEGGLPADRIFVKPPMLLPAPGIGSGEGDYALYAGRLSPEKGIDTLAKAWTALPNVPLHIVGDGPLSTTPWPSGVTAHGHQPQANLYALLQNARVLIVPSLAYEIGPLTILEAFACGTPVIASNLGTMAERVRHHHNGLLFRAGDPEDLARQVRWAFDHPDELRAMRANARREFEEKYTAERNYKLLMAIYEQAIENAQRRAGKRAAS